LVLATSPRTTGESGVDPRGVSWPEGTPEDAAKVKEADGDI